jgi:hypothetical protein
MSIRFELPDNRDVEAWNATLLDVRDGEVFVGAVMLDGRRLIALHAGANAGAGVVAMLDQVDIQKLQQALCWACQAHGGRPAPGVMSW